MNMNNFAARSRDFDRRFNWFRKLGCILALVWASMVLVAVDYLTYVLTHPHLIGEYMGAISNGIEGSR